MNFRLLLTSAILIFAAFAALAEPPVHHAKRQKARKRYVITRPYVLTPRDLAAQRQLQRLRKAADADDLLINRKTN